MSGLSGIGSSSGALQNAQLGITRGMARVAQDAQAVAGSSATGSDPTADLLDAHQQALNVEASAKAFSIADKTLGTLLDIKA
jgi:hypothetical protein